MSILFDLKFYADKCLSDKQVSEYEDYVSCKKHKWACQRFLNDVNRIGDEDFPYVWNEKEAEKIVDWFALLRHSKGILAGKPIILTPWQKFILCQLYGWRHKKTGFKRFKKSFVEVARKNAKSQMEAGVALYEISVQAVKNHEVYEYYTAGVKREQSKIIFNEAKLMLNGSPLRNKFHITRDMITHIVSGSFIKPLNKEDGSKGDGTNPAGLILDEYHQHRTTEFYDLGLGSNTKEPLLMIITTAGVDLTYPCYTQEYEFCSDLLNPDVEEVVNDTYFADIMELDTEDYENIDNLKDERKWFKANPIRMTYEKGKEKIREEYDIAVQIPEKMIAFLTKCMDVWVQAKENGYMNMSKWKKCRVKKPSINTRGYPVYVGFDMSAKIDLTSVGFVIPYQTDMIDDFGKKIVRYVVYSHSFIPNRQKLAERILKDKVPYDAWERQGYLTITNSEIVNQSVVMKYVVDTCKKNEWEIQTLCFDPANSSKLMTDFSDEGYDVEEVYQSHRSLNESTAGFREQVYDGNVEYEYNPVLNFAMKNAVIKQSNGLIKIDKDATTKRIDPVDALLCAFKLALYHIFDDGSYEKAIEAFLEEEF